MTQTGRANKNKKKDCHAWNNTNPEEFSTQIRTIDDSQKNKYASMDFALYFIVVILFQKKASG